MKEKMDTKRIKTALISVFHKDGLEELLAELNKNGVKFLSTGGTQAFIESLGYACEKVEDLTTYPSILGGRVKTLHPKVFGGILGRRELESDQQEMAKYAGISLIRAAAKNFNDVVIVPSKAEYGPLTDIIKAQGAETTKEQRKWFAERAFATSSHYDTAIDAYFKA